MIYNDITARSLLKELDGADFTQSEIIQNDLPVPRSPEIQKEIRSYKKSDI